MLQYQIFHHVVSIHAPYAGSDHGFNPRPLCRERRCSALSPFPLQVFQSTPPMQGATFRYHDHGHNLQVSIHAPYAGSDFYGGHTSYATLVSIHAPYAGSDNTASLHFMSLNLFQSTPPMQGATTQCGLS